MKRRLFCAVVMLGAISWLLFSPTLRTMAASRVKSKALSEQMTAATPDLSSYWSANLRRWSAYILREAERCQIDPDLLASLIWKESRGDAAAIGPAGATGLMQIMPKEAGFSWRPDRAALLDPATNVGWGTRTLSIVIQQSHGDIFSALAAYNGGWERISYRGPQGFATSVLRHYAHAVAERQGLTSNWTAVFAVRQAGIRGPIWVAEAGRDDVYKYGDDNLTAEGGLFIPNIEPTSVVAVCTDEESGAHCDVSLWIFDHSAQQWVASSVPVIEPTPDPTPTPRPTPEPASEAPPVPSVYVMAGSRRPSPAQPASSSAAPSQPHVTPSAEQTASLPTPVVPSCPGGSLVVQAWPLERTFTAGGWKVRIYAEGRGGHCVYSYAWNEESDVRVANVTGSATFEITSTRRDAPILGTVVVISGDQVKRVGVYVEPPR